jgi:asparagine synthase (glutamine-hydrolysing)
MCGFAGFFGGTPTSDAAGELDLLRRMGDTLLHRGPDSRGEWLDRERRIGFGYRRLAILDLSSAGHQPMHSSHGRFVISFNGEIYNHMDLRASLEAEGSAPAWRGHSDTETLVAGFEAWGIEKTIRRSIGMFAFAVWDRARSILTLGRDRMGEKPLYFGWQGRGPSASFLFGSELKALKVHPAFQGLVDRNALALFFRHNYIPSPYSIFQGIGKLDPGCLLEVSLEQPVPRIWPYWSLQEVIGAGLQAPFRGSETDAVDELESLLKQAIGQQMLSDVPLGAFLSGGIDSSTIVALMQAQSSRPVKTFTIGFEQPGYNEAIQALAVARHLGTEHTEMYVTPQDALSVIPSLPDLYDEPFSDSSQIPTHLVARLARQHVTVSLSGDAGDELFAGYDRYTFAHRLWGLIDPLPQWLRAMLGRGLQRVSTQGWNWGFDRYGGLLPDSLRMANAGDKIHKGAEVLASKDLDSLYLGLISHWKSPETLVRDGREPKTIFSGIDPGLATMDGISRMMALDAMTYLPDDILVKVDRAAMGVSLESRVPMLDHRVVAFAWRLPLGLKIRDGVSKWLLRQVLYRHVPKALVDRPKMGFSVPIDAWLRGPLRGWAGDLLASDRLRQEGFLAEGLVRQKWEEHIQGKRNWQHHLWDVLMFEAWLENQNNM